MLEFLTDTVTIGAILGIVLAGIARFVPNEKLFSWGEKAGRFLNSLGSARMGSTTWEKLEDFLVNSIGEYLKGLKFGLDADEESKVNE